MAIAISWEIAIEMSRHRARVLALQSLYEADTAGHDPEAALLRLAREKKLAQPTLLFAQELVNGVKDNASPIDVLIARFAPAFPVAELSPVDRNILRLAIFEIVFNNKVPVAAAINEAVELAKEFGSESSPRFINGVLGSISKLREEKGGENGDCV